MSIACNPLHPLFGVEIVGADIARDDAREIDPAIADALARYAVAALRDQFIDDAQQIAFSRRFGPLELPPHLGMRTTEKRRIAPEMYDVSNLDAQGELLPPDALRHASNRANEMFHTDSSFNALPTKWSLLSARVVPPEGADTLFIDTRAVYDALPDDLKARAEDAVAEHYFWKTRSKTGYDAITEEMKRAMPPARHPVVRVIPESGRKALYIGNHATHIVGWPREEGERFLERLNAFAADPRFVYAHKWRAGDLVIWDNRCTLHRATPYDVFRDKRDLRRTTVNESGAEISSTAALGVPPSA